MNEVTTSPDSTQINTPTNPAEVAVLIEQVQTKGASLDELTNQVPGYRERSSGAFTEITSILNSVQDVIPDGSGILNRAKGFIGRLPLVGSRVRDLLEGNDPAVKAESILGRYQQQIENLENGITFYESYLLELQQQIEVLDQAITALRGYCESHEDDQQSKTRLADLMTQKAAFESLAEDMKIQLQTRPALVQRTKDQFPTLKTTLYAAMASAQGAQEIDRAAEASLAMRGAVDRLIVSSARNTSESARASFDAIQGTVVSPAAIESARGIQQTLIADLTKAASEIEEQSDRVIAQLTDQSEPTD